MNTLYTPGPWKCDYGNQISKEFSNYIGNGTHSIVTLCSMLDGVNNEAKWKEMQANASKCRFNLYGYYII